MIGLHAVAQLEGGGVLATCRLVDLDLGSFEKVVLELTIKIELMQFELCYYLDEFTGVFTNVSGLNHFA